MTDDHARRAGGESGQAQPIACTGHPLDACVTPVGTRGVYIVALQDIDLDALPVLIRGKPITAWAVHPGDANRLYVTTEHPEALAFLREPYVDLRP